MNGSAAIRGFLLQTTICLLEALQHDSDWVSFRLEPTLESEKVDIIWLYPHPNGSRVTQVRSSQNQINKRHAETWAKELEESIQAASYELILIGPCSDTVAKLGRVGKVEIPRLRPLDVNGLLEQCAHRLDVYCEGRGDTKVSAATREVLVRALVTELEMYSTGQRVSRADFGQLMDKLLTATPEQVARPSRRDLLRLRGSLQQALSEVPLLRDLHLDHPDGVRWRTTVKRNLGELDRLLPGADYVEDYDLVAWHPPNGPPEDTDAQSAQYTKACDIAAGKLKAALWDIDQKLHGLSEAAE